jgi:Ni,Fe-hydrogenase III small subunit
MMTEVMSLVGDKYSTALPFAWEFSTDYASSQVVLWDGVITVKNASIVEKMIEDVKKGKVLLMIGESMTLLKDHPMVKIQNTENLNVVEVPGWNVLPEEILVAIETCQKKSGHV